MKKTFYSLATITAFIIIASLTTTALFSQAEIVDRVVAIVNDTVITLSELKEEGAPLFNRIREKAPPAERETYLQQASEDTLTQLINARLIQQQAADFGLKVEEAEIDKTIANIIRQNNITREDFLQDLKKIGTTQEAHRQTIKRQILKSRIVNMEVRSKIVISDRQVKAYYDDEYVKQDAPNGFTLLQIGLKWGPEARSAATKEDAVALAAFIRQKAAEGVDFKQLAREYSDMPSAQKGGAIGSFAREELAPFMREAILSLKPGELSQSVESETTIQIFKLLSIKEDDVVSLAPFDSVKEDIREIIFNQEMEESYKNWTKQLREKAYIKRLL